MDRDFLESYVEQGLSTRQISSLTNKSQTAIRHWLKKYNLKTKNKSFKNGYNNIRKVTIDNQHCSSCKIKLNPENSYYRKSKEIYTSLCKKCHSNYTLNRRKKFKQFCIEYKGGSCVKCGYNKLATALDFHHLNPKEKEILPSRMMNKSNDFIQKELDKCVLLCSNCHREEHYNQEVNKKLQKSFDVFNSLNFSNSILTGSNTNLPSCKNCDLIFDISPQSNGRTNICKSCDSKLAIEYTIKAKERAVEYMGGKCSHCGYNKCIRALEFHHLDPSKKSPTYNKRFRSWGFEKQKKELENCILVCSNCHREIHSRDEWTS